MAWQQGADAIEGDFHLTADGHIVCHHDPDIDSARSGKLVISDTKLEILKQQRPDLPTLPKVLGSIPVGKRLFLEVKCGAEIIPRLLSDIYESGLEADQISVISFSQSVIQSLKTKAPQYQAYWLVKRQGLGLNAKPKLSEMLNAAGGLGADGISIKCNRYLTKDIAFGITEAGMQFHTWTVDNVKLARKLTSWGASSITTNKPGLLVSMLDE